MNSFYRTQLHRNHKPLISAVKYGVLAFLIIAVSIWYLGVGALEIHKENLNRKLATIVENISTYMDGDKHEQLLKEGETSTDLYFELLAPLVQIHNNLPDIVYLYTMKDVGGHFVYGLDTAMSPDLKSNKQLIPDPVNAIYEAENYTEWSNALKLGKSYVFDDFITDQYGVLMTATMPFYNSKNEYVGSINVDVDVEFYRKNQQEMHNRICISLIIAAILSFLLGFYIYKNQNAIQRLQKKLYLSTIVDPLTDTYNRRYFEESYQLAQQLLVNKGINYCLAILDLDFFKLINDRFGHQAGDIVLTTVAKMIKNTVRNQDTVFRYGGEEFIIIFTNTNIREAQKVSKRLIKLIKETEIEITEDQSVSLTASIGVTQAIPSTDPVKVADKLLYKAKNNGRDRVEVG